MSGHLVFIFILLSFLAPTELRAERVNSRDTFTIDTLPPGSVPAWFYTQVSGGTGGPWPPDIFKAEPNFHAITGYLRGTSTMDLADTGVFLFKEYFSGVNEYLSRNEDYALANYTNSYYEMTGMKRTWQPDHYYVDGSIFAKWDATLRRKSDGAIQIGQWRRGQSTYHGRACPKGYKGVILRNIDASTEYFCAPKSDAMNPEQNYGASCNSGPTNPINLSTGNKYQEITVISPKGSSPLYFKFYYNSQRSAAGKWTHSFSRHLTDTLASSLAQNASAAISGRASVISISAVRDDGRTLTFWNTIDWTNKKTERDTWFGSSTSAERLLSAYDDSGNLIGLLLEDEAGNRESYDINGRLLNIGYDDGRFVEARYNAQGKLTRLIDEFGNTLRVSRKKSNGNIQAVVDLTGNRFRIKGTGKDNSFRLKEIIFPDATLDIKFDNPTTKLLYEDQRDNTLLTGLVDPANNVVGSWAYDDQGRAVLSVKQNGSHAYSVAYNPDGSATVTDPYGISKTFKFKSVLGINRVASISGEYCNICINSVAKKEYNAAGNLERETDFRGNVTYYEYNDRNLLTLKVEGEGSADPRTTTIQWEPDFNKPDKITVGRLTTDYDYNKKRKLIRVTKTSSDTSLVSKTIYKYYSNNKLKSVDGPRKSVDGVNDVTLYRWDSLGNLSSITNAYGHKTTFKEIIGNKITEYANDLDPSELSRIVEVTSPNGSIRYKYYDLKNREVRSSIGDRTITYIYNDMDQLVEEIGPKSNSKGVMGKKIYTYDANGNVDLITNEIGESIKHKYDQMNNLETVTYFDRSGTARRHVNMYYDNNNRLAVSEAGMGQQIRTTYNPQGLVKTIKNPNVDLLNFDYDSLNRRNLLVDPAGVTSTLVYDEFDNVEQVTDPKGNTTHYSYNGLGYLVGIESPDSGPTSFVPDEAGNIVSKTGAKGEFFTYRYDALNRITSVEAPNPADSVYYEYDQCANGIGSLCSVRRDKTLLTYAYNNYGEVVERSQSYGETPENSTAKAVLNYQYDQMGLLVGMVYPSGMEVSYQRNLAGQIKKMEALIDGRWLTLAQNINYAPEGPIKSLKRGSRLESVKTELDADYRVLRILSDNLDLNYEYWAGTDRVKSVESRANGSFSALTQYYYDSFGRLESFEESGKVTSWTFDANGNRIETKTDEELVKKYAIAPNSNQLQSVTDVLKSSTSTVENNQFGNATVFGGIAFDYTSDNLVDQTSNGMQYIYNGMGLRMGHRRFLQHDSDTQFFFFDDTRLLSEYDFTGKSQKEYIYLNDRLFAVVDSRDGAASSTSAGGGSGSSVSKPTLFYVNIDALGTPKSVEAEGGKVVWQAQYSPFGLATVNDNPDGDSQTFTLSHRFPGQYYDDSTGLHYNINRDYDPHSGRYLQTDPIGLVSGFNTYLYTSHDPINNVDKNGLFAPAVFFGARIAYKMFLSSVGVLGAREVAKNAFENGAITVPSNTLPENTAEEGEKTGELMPRDQCKTGDPDDCEKLVRDWLEETYNYYNYLYKTGFLTSEEFQEAQYAAAREAKLKLFRCQNNVMKPDEFKVPQPLPGFTPPRRGPLGNF